MTSFPSLLLASLFLLSLVQWMPTQGLINLDTFLSSSKNIFSCLGNRHHLPWLLWEEWVHSVSHLHRLGGQSFPGFSGRLCRVVEKVVVENSGRLVLVSITISVWICIKGAYSAALVSSFVKCIIRTSEILYVMYLAHRLSTPFTELQWCARCSPRCWWHRCEQ